MRLLQDRERRLDRLADSLRRADQPAPDIISAVTQGARTRLPLLNRTGAHALQVDRLVDVSAWTDLAIAIVAIELPGWKIRRLLYEDGAWTCSLSKQVNLPLGWDDTVDASHQNLPLAILSAFVEVRRRDAERTAEARTVPQVETMKTDATKGDAVCCENFA